MQEALRGLTLKGLVLDFVGKIYDRYGLGYPRGLSDAPMAMDIQEWAHELSYCMPSLQQLLIKAQVARGKQRGFNIEWRDSGVRLLEMPQSEVDNFLRSSKRQSFGLLG